MNSTTNQVSSCDLVDEEHRQLCASKHCPCCGYTLHGNPDWEDLPAGVKFDPTDQELIQHLEAKVELEKTKSHPLIDEFIPTIDGEDGICYTHPEKLPGVRRDGLSKHFFHRPSKAYTTGTRKRRKIQTEGNKPPPAGETRWHKTGKTRPVMVKGKQKGCKKILVLYTNFGKNRKPEKTNWVMHQYHLGQHEEEKEGELVVSKIFFQTQPRQCSSGADNTSTAGVAPIPDYSGIDNFGYFPPVRKPLNEATVAGIGNVGEASMGREGGGTCEERDKGHHHQHLLLQGGAIAAYHMSRDYTHCVSPSMPLINSNQIHTAISNSFRHQDTSCRIFHDLPNIRPVEHSFQMEEEEGEQHDQIGGRSASGLEELIMGCTSSSTNDIIKQPNTMESTTMVEEAEWLKYSSFWPDHHG